MSDSNVVDLIDQEEAVYRARLAGKPVRRIAHEFRLTVGTVQGIIERLSPTIDNRLRLATIALDVERLDELGQVFYQNAADGDVQSAAVLLKIQERRATLLGLNCPASVDPVRLPDPIDANSTQRMIEMIDAIKLESEQATLRLVSSAPGPDPEAPVEVEAPQLNEDDPPPSAG